MSSFTFLLICACVSEKEVGYVNTWTILNFDCFMQSNLHFALSIYAYSGLSY